MFRAAFLLLLTSIVNVPAQPYEGPDTLWTRVHPFPDIEFLTSSDIIEMADDGALIAGFIYDELNVRYGYYLIRLDREGQIVWRQCAGDSTTMTYDPSFVRIGENRFVLACYDGRQRVHFLLTDSLGSVLREHTFTRPLNHYHELVRACPSADGGFLLVYKDVNLPAQSESLAWIRLTAQGDSLWTRQFEIPGYRVWISSIAPMADGGYAIAGYSGLLGQGSHALVVRLDAAGSVMFYRTYQFADLENHGNDIVELGNGDLLLCGDAQWWDMNRPILGFVLRISGMGDSLRSWNPSAENLTSCISRLLMAPDGGYIAAGDAAESQIGTSLYRFDADDNLLWQRLYFITNYSSPLDREITRTSDCGFLLAQSDGASTPAYLVVLRTAPDPVAADVPFIPHPSAFSLSVSPNPFNAATRITFELPDPGNVVMNVYDLLGREVVRLVNGDFLSTGEHTISFSGETLTAGVYFCRMQFGGGEQVCKLLLVK